MAGYHLEETRSILQRFLNHRIDTKNVYAKDQAMS